MFLSILSEKGGKDVIFVDKFVVRLDLIPIAHFDYLNFEVDSAGLRFEFEFKSYTQSFPE